MAHFLQNNHKNKPFHLIIGGTANTMLQEAHQAVNLREIGKELNFWSIGKISSTGFSSVLAFLLCLDIDKSDVLSEVIGLKALIKAHPPASEDSLDIIELLSRRVDTQ